MEVPSVFYKYRSLAGKDGEYVRSTLVGGNIYLQNPASFNDPFDCAPAFSPTFSGQGAYALAKRYLRRQNPRWNEEKLEVAARQFARQTRRADMGLVADGLRQGYESVRQWLAVYCVSGTCTNPLMWAHYADSHRGICIGFASDLDIFARAQLVSYSHVRRAVDPLHDSIEQGLVNSLLLKSDDWKYEQEWRYIDFEGGPGLRQIATSVVRQVILGARISRQDEVRVLSWCRSMAPQPEIMRAQVSPVHFEVEMVPWVQAK